MSTDNWSELATSDRLRVLAEDIQRSYNTDTPHNQDRYTYDCGTPSCLAGYAVARDPRFEITADGFSGGWPYSPVLKGEKHSLTGWEETGIMALGDYYKDYGFVDLFNSTAEITPAFLVGLADHLENKPKLNDWQPRR